ncbi:MAG TPA: hypothetical protein VHO07_12555 [Streptosporangiaceae bacterium]|jgi:ATPase subunit of ABC transporter with duplicated ATPase domains|nr:hypothetical protein [Streptosporangiaceae bacterium]
MIITIGAVAAIVTIIIGISSGVRWVYRRGQTSGVEKAEHEADRRAQVLAQAEAQAEIRALKAVLAEVQADAKAEVEAVKKRLAKIQAELDWLRVRHPLTLSAR